jgi:hypothetical protein
MASPFQAITTGEKSLAQRASEPLKSVRIEGQKRREAAEGAYDSYGYTFGNLPANQIPVAQQWADAVRENLVEGYRTGNNDMIRQAKQQGTRLQGYIKSMEQDYTIGRNSVVKAREKNYRGLSETQEQIETGFKNRYEVPISLETDGNGYPINAVISGLDGMENRITLNELENGLKDNPFIVVDAVNLGTNYNPERISSRWAQEIGVAKNESEARQMASKYANTDIQNQMVSNEDMAVLYLVQNKAINASEPSNEDLERIKQVQANPEMMEAAKSLWASDYEEKLVNQWRVQQEAMRQQQQRAEQAAIRSENRRKRADAEAGILSMTPFTQGGLKTYDLDTKGLRFDVGQGREISEVAYDSDGNLSRVVTQTAVKDIYGNVQYNTETLLSSDGTLTEGMKQKVEVNLTNLSGGKSGYQKLTSKQAAPNVSGAAGMLGG